MTFFKSSPTPILLPSNEEIVSTRHFDSTNYREATDILMCLMLCTCPGISFAQILFQFVENPTVAIYTFVKRMLCYVSGNKCFGIFIERMKQVLLLLTTVIRTWLNANLNEN